LRKQQHPTDRRKKKPGSHETIASITDGAAGGPSNDDHLAPMKKGPAKGGNIYRTLFEFANDAIFIEKFDRFVDCNTKALEIYGCRKDELVGKTYVDLSPERQPDGTLSRDKALPILRLAEQGKPQFFEWKVRKPDGTLFDTEVSLTRIQLSGEVFLLAIVRDVTRRKQVEESLLKALSDMEQVRGRLEADYTYLQEEIRIEQNFDEIIGQSDALKHVLRKLEQIAPTDTTVLLLGETGVGKDLFARAIHNLSPRKNRPLVKVNCATLPSNLIDSELFGHERGAFTGAHTSHVGRFELANGATLFLDELGELPPELQAKLLRVLQDGEFERVGGSHTIRTDARVIAATNRELEEEVRSGRFRKDLWYRINVFPVSIPPLRQRKEDIPPLVRWLVNKFAKKLRKSIKTIPHQVMKSLEAYPWPGNVRELENVLERAVISSQGPTLLLADKLELPRSPGSPDTKRKTLVEMEREYLVRVLEETYWRIEGEDGAAGILGLHPSTLRGRLRKLGIRRERH
jgi:PAS domain S-box-containing protein